MGTRSKVMAGATREERLKRALFRGEMLTLENPAYLRAVQTLTDALLEADEEASDRTIGALGIPDIPRKAEVLAREAGIVAGLQEAKWLGERAGLRVKLQKQDGAAIEPGEAIAQLEGGVRKLLSLERLELNLIQRMSGIATATRRAQEIVRRQSPSAQVVATRKTPWGLLDKRAVHLGGGGTHRLGLGDAILIKNNHLQLLGLVETEAVPLAIERAWPRRQGAAFVEVEVRSGEAALAAAKTFQHLQENDRDACPCLILLDNQEPEAIARTVALLRAGGLWEAVMLEASGKITEANLGAYAASGVDALSMGSLTHSSRALDISQRLDS